MWSKSSRLMICQIIFLIFLAVRSGQLLIARKQHLDFKFGKNQKCPREQNQIDE